MRGRGRRRTLSSYQYCDLAAYHATAPCPSVRLRPAAALVPLGVTGKTRRFARQRLRVAGSQPPTCVWARSSAPPRRLRYPLAPRRRESVGDATSPDLAARRG